VNEFTIYQMVGDGRLPAFKLGNNGVFKKDALEMA